MIHLAFCNTRLLRNPLLGSGYSTLTKYTNESLPRRVTDNDFLKLGETGALGFVTFYGTMVVAFVLCGEDFLQQPMEWFICWRCLQLHIPLVDSNAVYIDVFVSSKVIQTYWMVIGISLAMLD